MRKDPACARCGRRKAPACLDGELHEECGVFGAFNGGTMDTAGEPYLALHAMQHRGQDGAGLAATDGEKIIYHKGVGLLSEVFSDGAQLAQFAGKNIVIGHVRYATCASAHTVINTQPLVMHSHGGGIALAHNGHLINSAQLRRELMADGHLLQTEVDTEVFLHIIARESRGYSIESGIQRMMEKVRGSYALVMMTPGKLYGVRDPWGIRPLVLGVREGSYFLASESCAFDAIGARLVREVNPGEIIVIDRGGYHSIQTPERGRRMCVFEYVYFARMDSVMSGVGVCGARIRSGERLSEVAPVEAELVAGVPESAIPAAMGYSRRSGIPFGQALIKNPYTGRTFITPGQASRERSVRMKLSPVREMVEGKRIVLVDDSIVRGTNSLQIVDMLRQAGAKEVHMRIASPPVLYPCHFGINTPTSSQLISAQYDEKQVCKKIGADSLAFLPIASLQEAVSKDLGLCTGCFSGEYPMPVGQDDPSTSF